MIKNILINVLYGKIGYVVARYTNQTAIKD